MCSLLWLLRQLLLGLQARSTRPFSDCTCRFPQFSVYADVVVQIVNISSAPKHMECFSTQEGISRPRVCGKQQSSTSQFLRQPSCQDCRLGATGHTNPQHIPLRLYWEQADLLQQHHHVAVSRQSCEEAQQSTGIWGRDIVIQESS